MHLLAANGAIYQKGTLLCTLNNLMVNEHQLGSQGCR